MLLRTHFCLSIAIYSNIVCYIYVRESMFSKLIKSAIVAIKIIQISLY